MWRSQAGEQKLALAREFGSEEEIGDSFSVLHLYSKGAIMT